MEYLNEYKKWCTSDVFDEETKKELLNIKEKQKIFNRRKINNKRSINQYFIT